MVQITTASIRDVVSILRTPMSFGKLKGSPLGLVIMDYVYVDWLLDNCNGVDIDFLRFLRDIGYDQSKYSSIIENSLLHEF